MTPIFLIAKRDLASYFNGFGGYLIVAAVLFIDGVLYNTVALGTGAKYSHEVLEQFFYFSSGTTMIASVLLTMRSLAEERQTGTEVLLFTAPISELQVVLGKYLAAMGMLSILTVLTLYMPALIFVHGKVSFAHIGVGYLGLMLLGSAVVSIGTWSSAVSRSQVAAAILGGVVVTGMLITWLLSQLSEPPFTEVLAYMSLFDKHFQPFMRGRLQSTGVAYYLSVTFGFLLLAVRSLQGRRRQ